LTTVFNTTHILVRVFE